MKPKHVMFAGSAERYQRHVQMLTAQAVRIGRELSTLAEGTT
jgi:hypothetical protein